MVDNERVAAMLNRHGERAIARLFSAAERDYCERQTRRRIEHYAARFAAKEAVLKALGTGWRHGIAWTDVEVTRAPSGRPGVRLTGEARRLADQAGIAGWALSLSHTESHALASAIAWIDAAARG